MMGRTVTAPVVGPRRRVRLAGAALLAVLAAALVLPTLGAWAQEPEPAPTVLRTRVDAEITPIVGNHLTDALAAADEGGHAALVVELDTPGGLAAVTQDITTAFLNAPVPVIVYVSPSGARAASAGAFITASAHVAAMAPATNIGAATPVLQGRTDIPQSQLDKIIADSAAQISAIAERRDRNVDFYVDTVTDGRSERASVALEQNAIDLIAGSLPQALDDVDGTAVELDGGRRVELSTADAAVVDFDMSAVRRVLQALASPQVALTLVSIGTLALIYELASPGGVVPGVVGAILLLVGLFSLNQLPVDIVGVLLLVVALGLFIAELFAPGIGVFAGGGALALVAGGLLLFDEPTGVGVDPGFLIPVALAVTVVMVVLGRLAWRSRHTQTYQGPSGEYAGTITEVRDVDAHDAWIWYEGSRWRARRTDGGRLELGQRVRVAELDGLTVMVEPVDDPRASAR